MTQAPYRVILFGVLPLSFSLAPNETIAQSIEDSAAQCETLLTADFVGIQDAPTQLAEAKFVEASDAIPSHCHVKGYITPNVGIEMKLPTRNWNGKFLHIGCGGFCGQPQPFPLASVLGCGIPLRKGYACIGTDMGHHGAGAVWAYNNLQAEVDFGYRATHVSALAGKAITERYYGTAPTKAYFTGCSTGGRQALVAAQRFPSDFDGIVAMDPAINFSEIFVTILWNSRMARNEDGKPLFSDPDIRTLHEAVLAKCDLNDGVKDRLIGDPRDCELDLDELSCKKETKSGCLTPEQITAAKKIYNGPTTSAGNKIAKGGVMLGAESGVFGFGIADAQDKADASTGSVIFPAHFFRYMAFMADPGPEWEASDFDFDRDYRRLGMMEALYASANPDLRKFKANGGKLILTQGWHDAGLPFAFNSIDYYEAVERTTGGRAVTQEFFRFFTVPGRDHCAGGDGAWAIDHLGYLENWVENGKAPEMLMSYHPTDPDIPLVQYPPAQQDFKFSRPVYPYPLKAKYKGKGDPNRAENFEAVRP